MDMCLCHETILTDTKTDMCLISAHYKNVANYKNKKKYIQTERSKYYAKQNKIIIFSMVHIMFLKQTFIDNNVIITYIYLCMLFF